MADMCIHEASVKKCNIPLDIIGNRLRIGRLRGAGSCSNRNPQVSDVRHSEAVLGYFRQFGGRTE